MYFPADVYEIEVNSGIIMDETTDNAKKKRASYGEYYIHTYIHTYTHTYIHTYIHAYIHTHT